MNQENLAKHGAGTGMDAAARRMQQLEVVVARASDIAEFLPQQMRWEVELMLYDFEDRQSFDINDYTRAAEAWSATAVQWRALTEGGSCMNRRHDSASSLTKRLPAYCAASDRGAPARS